MKRPLRPEEVQIWSVVASTVAPIKGRVLPRVEAEPSPPPQAPLKTPPKFAGKPAKGPAPAVKPAVRALPHAPRGLHLIEPNRERRLARGRDELEARIDLHGLDQDRARTVLEGFLFRAQADGHRAVLVITGKGSTGDGVLKRRLPDWLNAQPLRAIVAGVSEARRWHGGKGAVYVALKRL
jgi:DNA-nicking Smr family endonuclease